MTQPWDSPCPAASPSRAPTGAAEQALASVGEAGGEFGDPVGPVLLAHPAGAF